MRPSTAAWNTFNSIPFFFTSDVRIKYLNSSSYINIAFIIYSFQSISVHVIYVTTHPKQMKELSENRVEYLRSALFFQSRLQDYILKYPILHMSHEWNIC
jgi:hypothetical protein